MKRSELTPKALAYVSGLLIILSFVGPAGELLVPYSVVIMLAVQCVAFGLLAMINIRRKLSRHELFFLLSLFVFFAWSLMSSLWSEAYFEVVLVRVLITLFPVLLLSLVISSNDAFEVMNKFCKVFVFGVYGLVLVAVVLYFYGSEVYIEGRLTQQLSIGPVTFSQCLFGSYPFYRVCSLVSNPNSLGMYVAIAAPLLIYMRKARLLSNFYFMVLMLAFVMSFLLTLSRASFGGFVVAVLSMYVLSSRSTSRAIVNFIGFILVSVILIVVSLGVNSSLSLARANSGLNAREEAWLILLEGFFDNPIAGVGFGVSNEALLYGNTEVSYAHSLYFMLLSELGVVGFLIFSGMWALVLFKSLALATKGSIAAAAIFSVNAGMLLMQVFEATVLRFGLSNYIWFFLAFLVLSLESAEKQILINQGGCKS